MLFKFNISPLQDSSSVLVCSLLSCTHSHTLRDEKTKHYIAQTAVKHRGNTNSEVQGSGCTRKESNHSSVSTLSFRQDFSCLTDLLQSSRTAPR